MTSREIVSRTIRFESPDRLVRDFPEPYGCDFAKMRMSPSPDSRPSSGVDEWGAVWDNIGISKMGEVREFPLKDWEAFEKQPVPDIRDPARWTEVESVREQAGGRFVMAGGISIYERVHFIRGLQNAWTDIHDHPEELGRLIDVLVEMNLYAIERFADAGADGYMFCDDWGLQTGLMISPDDWRRIWKPRYARVWRAAHDAGLLTGLHSCGYVVDILDDLIEAGLDIIQIDQQENMGLDLLGERYGGRITFYSPVDIQNTMAHGSLDDIRAYCRKMVTTLGRPDGGFMPRWYSDPVGAGHSQEALDVMCQEFLRLSDELPTLWN